MLLPLCGLLSGAGAARAARQAHWSRAAAGGRRLAAALGLAQPGPGGAAAPAPHARCAPHFFRSVLLATCRTLGLVQALNSVPAAACSGAATASIRRTVRPAAWDRRGRRDGLGASGPWGPCFCSRAAAPCAGSAVLRAEDICLRTQSGAAAFADTTPVHALTHAGRLAAAGRRACMWGPAHRPIAQSRAYFNAKHAACTASHAASGHRSRSRAAAPPNRIAMVFYIIGLGLADERDITVKWVALPPPPVPPAAASRRFERMHVLLSRSSRHPLHMPKCLLRLHEHAPPSLAVTRFRCNTPQGPGGCEALAARVPGGLHLAAAGAQGEAGGWVGALSVQP